MGAMVAYCSKCGERVLVYRQVPKAKKVLCLSCGGDPSLFHPEPNLSEKAEKHLPLFDPTALKRTRTSSRRLPQRRNRTVIVAVAGVAGLCGLAAILVGLLATNRSGPGLERKTPPAAKPAKPHPSSKRKTPVQEEQEPNAGRALEGEWRALLQSAESSPLPAQIEATQAFERKAKDTRFEALAAERVRKLTAQRNAEAQNAVAELLASYRDTRPDPGRAREALKALEARYGDSSWYAEKGKAEVTAFLAKLKALEKKYDSPPVKVKSSDAPNRVRVHLANGESWSFEARSRIRRTQIADTDGEGRPEVLLGTGKDGPDNGVVYCLSSSGAVKWRFVMGGIRHKHWPQSRDRFVLSAIVVADVVRDKAPEVIAVANVEEHFPSRTCILDGKTGANLGEYWHPGWRRRVAVGDLDGDGAAEIVLCGACNDPKITRNRIGQTLTLCCLDPKAVCAAKSACYCDGAHRWYWVCPDENVRAKAFSMQSAAEGSPGRVALKLSNGRTFHIDAQGKPK
ncbi:MAG: hypothetical protein ACYTHM_19545 [Planctomycetota bacterium]|jgi:hypothetical protein